MWWGQVLCLLLCWYWWSCWKVFLTFYNSLDSPVVFTITIREKKNSAYFSSPWIVLMSLEYLPVYSLLFTLMLPWNFWFKVSDFTLVKKDSRFLHSFSCSVSSVFFAFNHLPAAGLMSGLLLESTVWFDSCPGVLVPGGILKSIFLF